MVFNKYAQYYDLLYRDKDYVGEVNYIERIIKQYHTNSQKILDLGCGTGKHAELLSRKGYQVHGVDMSEGMLKEAWKKAARNDKLSFSLSNIQEFNLPEQYDVVTALFHVMSYQTTDAALEKVFQRTYEHLKQGGIFIFDCWYGPAVLSEKPEIRVKRLENEEVSITRIAEPVMRENENIVEVHYDVFVKDKTFDKIEELKEVHIMRYLFKNEICKIINACGFEYVADFAFMTNRPIDKSTWGSCFVVRK